MKVSVLIPLYQRSSRIHRAISSLQSQRDVEWELLCIQDGDAKEVRDAVVGLCAQDTRIRYLPRGDVGSIGAACNFGLQHARGEYIAILDDDDRWSEPYKLALQTSFLDRRTEYVGCGSAFRSVDEEEAVLGVHFKPRHDSEIRKAALIANPIANSSSLYRRSVALDIGGYDETLKDFQDWEFWIRCLGKGKLYNFQRIMLEYTVWSEGSSFKNLRSNARSAKLIVERYKHALPHALFAGLLVSCYGAYAQLPGWLLSPTFTYLSVLKKRLSSRAPKAIRAQPQVSISSSPSISVLIPCVAWTPSLEMHVKFFRSCVASGVREILLICGGTKNNFDGKLATSFENGIEVRVVQNPRRYKSHGLNLGLAQSSGEIVLVVDAHSEVSNEYVEACVEALRSSGAVNVGGAQRYKAESAIQYFLALAVRTKTGSGGALYKNSEAEGFVDTVYLGCFLREALEIVGKNRSSAADRQAVGCGLEVFSEQHITNQDAEINQRLSELFDTAVYLSPEINVAYFPRSTIGEVVVQYFRYGRGRLLTSFGSRSFFVRGNIPFYALMSIGFLPLYGLCTGVYEAAFVWLASLSIVGADVYRGICKVDKKWEQETWRLDGLTPPKALQLWVGGVCMVFIMNVSHGLGFAYQAIRVLLKGKLCW